MASCFSLDIVAKLPFGVVDPVSMISVEVARIFPTKALEHLIELFLCTRLELVDVCRDLDAALRRDDRCHVLHAWRYRFQ